MKDLEKQIEEQCRLYSLGEENTARISKAFKDGITSDLAKEYWQQEMYSEEEVWKILNKYLDYQEHGLDEMTVKEWFELNKKK